MAGSFQSYKTLVQNEDEEQLVKNWEMKQSLMNKSLNELFQSLSNTSIELDNQVQVSPSQVQLNANSSTAEFKKYLDNLKKNYLEKLAFSCPSKMTTNNQDNESFKLKSVENLNNSNSKPNKVDTVRRSLIYETKENQSDFETDLTKNQILSRLVQIREYLKQAYSMLATLQTSNDLVNYSAQMNKLHSLIDHLKDQEQGYMDLLNSFSKFQHLTGNIYSDSISKEKLQKDLFDLSALNESLNQQNTMQISQQKQLEKSASNSASKRSNLDETKAKNDVSDTSSMTGSFISDTLTLNGANCNNINDIVNKYNIINSKNSNNLNLKNKTDDFNENSDSNLIIIGKGLNKSIINEAYEDEKTENDQDVLDFDEDYLNNLLKSGEKEDIDLENVKEQREEIIKEINTDIDTLEQLREQKKLLRSIRLRKEELKALEGRRKALEALKKIAIDGEKHLDQAFNFLVEPVDNKQELDNNEHQTTDLFADSISPNRKDSFYLKKKLTEKEPVHQAVQTETINELQSPTAKSKTLPRKTFKQSDKQSNSDLNSYNESSFSVRSSQSTIEPSSQIEKSKITAKHYEDLIRKILSEKYSENLVKAVSSSDLLKPGNVNENSATSYSLNNSTGAEKIVSNLENTDCDPEKSQELKSKLENLAENEKKLQELYSMQNKLSELKTIMNHFNMLKEKVNFKPINFEEEQNALVQNAKDESSEDESITSEDGEKDNEEEVKKELVEEHKKKLANAKEKLKELQDLVARLQTVSSGSGLDVSNFSISPKKLHELEQKEAAKALDYLNEIERQKREEKLEELKKSKQKLLEILKEKEQESAVLSQLHSSYSNNSIEALTHQNQSPESKHLKQINSTSDLSYLNEIENKFKTAENGFDILSLDKQNDFTHSPSDILWSQMKKQLNMRENLRNKKKELEDLIRDEYNSKQDPNRVEPFGANEPELNNDENNEIINGYRDFFLRKRTNLDSEKKAKLLSEFFEQVEVKKEESQVKQENICSADELIQNEDKNEEILNVFSKYNESETEDESEIEEKPKKDVEDVSSNLDANTAALNSLTSKIEEMFTSQQKANEMMQKNFLDALEKQKNNANFHSIETSQSQFQIQQLMFNLNTAYQEISSHRAEIAKLNEQIKKVNDRLVEFESLKANTSIGINTDNDLKNEDLQRSKRSSAAALPCYFYNRKPDSQKCESYYTDDFEELEEDDESKTKNSKFQYSKTPSQITQQTLRSLSKSSCTSSSSTTSTTTASKTTTASSTFALRKPQINTTEKYIANLRSSILSTNTTISQKSFTFDKMREQIYSEVATLISQNESRPFYLLNLFKELQQIRDKTSRDQVLKSIFNISNRNCSKHSIEPRYSNLNNQDNDDDDVVTYNFRMRKARKYTNYTTTTDSNMDDDDNSYLVKKYNLKENKKQIENDDEAESSQTPFESDSLSNTVIFVKNSPKTSHKKCGNQKSSSSGSSILGVNENTNEEKKIQSENIGTEVKQLISKIIAMIKVSDNFDDFDDEDDDNDMQKSLQSAKFDSDYMNEIIEKVLNVLRDSNRHFDYLRLYQNQLSSYLKDALNKYENKGLIDCMEDILIEISDILYNELTFYSIMNKSKCLDGSKLNEPEKLVNYSRSNSSISSDTNQEDIESNSEIKFKKVYLLDETEEKFNRCKNQSIELLKRLSSILNNKFGDINYENEEDVRSVLHEKQTKLASLLASANIRPEFDDLNKIKEEGEFEVKSLKFLNKNAEIDSSCCGEDDDNCTEEEKENGDESTDEEEDNPVQIQDANQLPYKVANIDEIKTSEEENKITIDDLPDKLDLNKLNEEKPTLEGLDKIIMDSISDDLVGDPDGLNSLLGEDIKPLEINAKNEQETKSESSNSDHFVLISSGSSDNEVIDIQKSEETVKPEPETEEIQKTEEPEPESNCIEQAQSQIKVK